MPSSGSETLPGDRGEPAESAEEGAAAETSVASTVSSSSVALSAGTSGASAPSSSESSSLAVNFTSSQRTPKVSQMYGGGLRKGVRCFSQVQ